MIRLLPATQRSRMGDLQYHHYLVQISEGTTLFRVPVTRMRVSKSAHAGVTTFVSLRA